MPHYANGRAAKQGDLVKSKPTYQGSQMNTIGIVASISAGATTCNAQLVPLAYEFNNGTIIPAPAGSGWPCVTLSECHLLVEERGQEVESA